MVTAVKDLSQSRFFVVFSGNDKPPALQRSAKVLAALRSPLSRYTIYQVEKSGRTDLSLIILLCLFFAIRLNRNLCNVFLDLVNDVDFTQRFCDAITRLRYAVPEEVLESRP